MFGKRHTFPRASTSPGMAMPMRRGEAVMRFTPRAIASMTAAGPSCAGVSTDSVCTTWLPLTSATLMRVPPRSIPTRLGIAMSLSGMVISSYVQPLEASASLVEIGLGLGEAEARECVSFVAAVERRARYRGHARPREQIHHSLLARRAPQARRVRQHVVRALRRV